MTKLTGSRLQEKFSKLTTTQQGVPRNFLAAIVPSARCANPECPFDKWIKQGQVRVIRGGNSYHLKCESKK